MNVITHVLAGSSVTSNPVITVENPLISIPGINQCTSCSLQMNDEMLKRGTLVTGKTGSGKTVLMKKISTQLRNNIKEPYSMVVIEVKKDYQSELYQSGDLFLAQGLHRSSSVRWNLYRDILADGWAKESVEINAREFCKQLFSEYKNQQQKFFVDAAQLLLYEVIVTHINLARNSIIHRKALTNKGLLDFFCNFTPEDYALFLRNAQDPGVLNLLLGDGDNLQALGVLAQTITTVLSTFCDVFGETGDFSIREFVKSQKRQCLFLEYDPAYSEMQKRIFGVLIDLMIKECLSQSSVKNNLIFVCDELPAIGKVDLVNAVNLGRSKGLIVLAGIQSISQLESIYDVTDTKSLLAGFCTKIIFPVNDDRTREYVRDSFGKNLVEEMRLSPGGTVLERRQGNVVEDSVINSLRTGDCIVGLPDYPPFAFHVEK